MKQTAPRLPAHGTVDDPGLQSDVLFLAEWERERPSNLGALLRAGQIRRANPALAEAVERDMKRTA